VMLFPAESRGDPFWFEAARSSFVAIGGYVAETPGLALTIGEILRQLSATQDLKTHFDKIITDRKGGLSPLSRHCITALNDFLAASENTLNSVRKTVTARLGLWLNPRIDAATSTNDFDLRQLRQRSMSIYLGVTPDNLDRMAPLLNLLFQQVVDLNTRQLPEQNPKLNRKVLLLLDEFPALGNVNVLAKSVAFIAGYGIRLLTVIQSPAQLRAIYGTDAARNFMTNHAVEVVFAPKEQDVANELSERIGYDTVKARSRSGPKGLAMRSTSETVSEHRRALMLPQELKLLPKTKAFILGASPRHSRRSPQTTTEPPRTRTDRRGFRLETASRRCAVNRHRDRRDRCAHSPVDCSARCDRSRRADRTDGPPAHGPRETPLNDPSSPS
jgi:type IV secretion system protein VirD4